MGGQSPYEDVQEEMAIKVKGTSETDCLGNLQTLVELFDQANSWGMDENVTAVEIQIQPKGSSTTVDAVIWDTDVIAPSDLTWLGATSEYVLQPVILRFVRRGLWLGTTETETSSASTGNPAVLTSSTFTDTADILWPYDAHAQFSNDPSFSTGGFYMAFSDQADKLAVVEGEAGTNTNMTDTAVAAASGGNVARTNTGGTTAKFTWAVATNLDSTLRKIQIFAMVRNNSSTISYTLTASYEYSALLTTTGKNVIVDTSSQNPQLIDLGIITSPVTFQGSTSRIVIDITADASITASNQLDLDYIVVVGLDDNSQIINIDSDGTDAYWVINHRLDSNVDPLVFVSSNGSAIAASARYWGDVVLSGVGNVIACVVFGPAAGDFVIEDSGNNELNATLSVTRTKSYLTPL